MLFKPLAPHEWRNWAETILDRDHVVFYSDPDYTTLFNYFSEYEPQNGTVEERALYAYFIALDLETNGAPEWMK
jgi:hypothetical protein